MTQVYERVIEIMTEYLTPEWVEESRVSFTPETTFKYLQMDVLDEIEISLLVEKEFKIAEIPDDMDWFHTVGDLVGYIEVENGK